MCVFLLYIVYIHNLTSTGPPEILTQPISVNTGVGKSVTFTVVASGEGLAYQWFGPGGVTLSDTPGKIAGANTPTLQLFNIQSNDTGSYQVQVVNAGGLEDSDLARLTIGTNDPNKGIYISQLLFPFYHSFTTKN